MERKGESRKGSRRIEEKVFHVCEKDLGGFRGEGAKPGEDDGGDRSCGRGKKTTGIQKKDDGGERRKGQLDKDGGGE